MQGRMTVYVSICTFYAYVNQCSMLCIMFYSQELSSDVMERKKRMTIAKLLLLIVIHIATNTFVILCLVAGTVAIFFSVRVVSYLCRNRYIYIFIVSVAVNQSEMDNIFYASTHIQIPYCAENILAV